MPDTTHHPAKQTPPQKPTKNPPSRLLTFKTLISTLNCTFNIILLTRLTLNMWLFRGRFYLLFLYAALTPKRLLCDPNHISTLGIVIPLISV